MQVAFLEYNCESLPSYFDKQILPKIDINIIVQFNEKYIKVQIVYNLTKAIEIKFSQDLNSPINLMNSEYSKPRSIINVKFLEEMQFCPSVFIDINHDSSKVGYKFLLFNHTRKKLFLFSIITD